MVEAPRQCKLAEYCRKIKNKQIPFGDESAKKAFAEGFRKQYLEAKLGLNDETHSCWLMNSENCALDPVSWSRLGGQIQDFMWTIADPLEEFPYEKDD